MLQYLLPWTELQLLQRIEHDDKYRFQLEAKLHSGRSRILNMWLAMTRKSDSSAYGPRSSGTILRDYFCAESVQKQLHILHDHVLTSHLPLEWIYRTVDSDEVALYILERYPSQISQTDLENACAFPMFLGTQCKNRLALFLKHSKK
jgi:hypothetical protein